jgi:hypothetical protein
MIPVSPGEAPHAAGQLNFPLANVVRLLGVLPPIRRKLSLTIHMIALKVTDE